MMSSFCLGIYEYISAGGTGFHVAVLEVVIVSTSQNIHAMQ
jgi:hypothetical protein